MSALLLLLAVAAPQKQVVYVDLNQAILGTIDGRRAKTQLEEEHRRINREIRGKEERLIHDKKTLEAKRYDEAAQQIQEEIAKRQEELEQKQEKLLAPIVEKMKKLVSDHNATGAAPLVLDLSEQPIVDPPKECDLTSWLIRAYAATKPPAPSPANPCRFDGFAYVDFDRALAQSAAGKSATKALDALKEKGQEELDKRQRQLAEIERTAAERPALREQYELERREVANLFAKIQRDLAQKERETEERLYRQLEDGLASARKKLPGMLFVEALEESGTRMTPSCDATEWAALMIDAKATAEDLRKSCAVAGR